MPHRTARRVPALALALALGCLASACNWGGPSKPDPEQQLQLHREFALRYFDQGDLNRAEQQVDKGLEIEDDDHQLLLMKGWIRQRRGTATDLMVAERIFREIRDGKDFRVEIGLGEALERKGVLYREASEAVASGKRYTEAADPKARAEELASQAQAAWVESLECYRKALELKPGEFQAMNGMQRVLALRGDYEESLRWAEELLSASKVEMDFWRERLKRQDLGAAEENHLHDLLAGSTELQVATHLTAATLLVSLDRTEDALAHLDSAAALRPDMPEIHSRRAQLLERLHRPAEAVLAIQEFLRSTDLPFEHPDVKRAYDLLAQCQREAHEQEAAATAVGG